MLRLLTPRRAAVAGVLGLALLGAACTSNDAGTSGSQTPAASPTTAAPMTASGPFGAACSTVPASGAGSLEALAQDPVATAASNTPELSTLVTAVKQADLADTLAVTWGAIDAESALPSRTKTDSGRVLHRQEERSAEHGFPRLHLTFDRLLAVLKRL